VTRPSMGLYEVDARHQKHSDKYKCRSHQRNKYPIFVRTSEKHVVLYHDLLIKNIHLILASDMSAKAIRDEVVRVPR
jgi:hypothetical protein